MRPVEILIYFLVIFFYYGDGIRNEDLKQQIEALRSEVRALSYTFRDLRQDEVRRVFGEQVRPILAERIERTFEELQDDRPKDAVKLMTQKEELVSWMDAVLEVFMESGKVPALSYMDEVPARGSVRRTRHPQLLTLVDDLETQLRSYFDTYDRVLRSAGDARRVIVQPGPPIKDPSPDDLSDMIGPLANPIRIRILRLLQIEDDGLSDLGRSLGMQKGHLQFHLRSLTSSGYVTYDDKSHLYSLSPRGRKALDGLATMYEELR